MAVSKLNKLSGPIPGENYTSDTRNYPWHRPPEHTNLDKAIEDIGKKLMEPNASVGLLTMLEGGMDVATLTSTFLMSGIGAGKWTPDMALLLAGPTSHIICLMAKGYDIEYDLGVDDKIKTKTSAYFNGFKKVEKKLAKEAVDSVDLDVVKAKAAEKPAASGMMGAPAPKEVAPSQNEMLGYEEEVV